MTPTPFANPLKRKKPPQGSWDERRLSRAGRGKRVEGMAPISNYDPLCPDHSKHERGMCPPRKPGEETKTSWPLPPKPIDPTAHWKRKVKP